MIDRVRFYTILDVSIEQLAMGLALLPLLVALTWYVSHPIHRRQLRARAGSDPRGDGRLVEAA